MKLRDRPVHVWDVVPLTFGSALDMARFAAAVLPLAAGTPQERVWLFTVGYGHSALFALAELPRDPTQLPEPRRERRVRLTLLRGSGSPPGPRFRNGDREGGGVLWAVSRSALEHAVRIAGPEPRAAKSNKAARELRQAPK